ncbi:hypothetical protein [Methanobrevibacter sp. UBA188]|uniref:hypothetical protein n=1 Tax=Methanobrevibacter sp. UBA188 TaxID=1915473 RepID=UPI0025E8DABB|nr:hypothetical protein [Methanobrevibacter sp. UBA188]
MNILNLDYGTYKVDFIYSGDESHDGFVKSANVEFTYKFYVYPVDEDTYNFGYGEDVEFYVSLPSIAGSIEYVVNGKKYTISKEDIGTIVVKAQDLKMGKNNISFSYIPNRGPVKTDYCLINVKYLVEIVPQEILYDGVAYLTLELPSDAKGDLNIYKVEYSWDDEYGYRPVLTLIKNVKVENGIVNESLSGFGPGYHKIYANYTGSDYLVGMKGMDTDVYDEMYSIGVSFNPKVVFPAKMWKNGVYDCDFILPDNYSGILTVNVGDEEKTYNVVNGKGKFVINASKFDYSDELYLYFEGEDGYRYSDYFHPTITDQDPKTKLELYEHDYQVIVKGKESYHAWFNIDDCDVKIYVDDVFYGVENDGYVYIETGNLTLGKHDVRFEVSGDDYFVPSTAYDSFNVTYINFYIPENIIIGENYGSSSTAYIVIAKDVTGEAKLIVDGVETESEKITGSNVYFDLDSLSYGNHTVTLAYQNGNYASSSKTGSVNAKYRYYLDFGDLIYDDGEATVYLPNDATGDVKVIINGKEFKETVKDGKATFHITGILAGKYETTVIYGGDKKYPAETVRFNTTIYYQINRNFNNDVFVDDLKDSLITLYMPEDARGNLTVYLKDWDGDEGDYVYKKVASSEFIGGKAQIALSQFSNELKSYEQFVVKYEGDDYEVEDYDFDVELKVFDVIGPDDKEHLQIGQNIEYKIKVPKNAHGYMKVYAGIDYEDLIMDNVPILNGVATIPLKYDEMGLWGIKILYVRSDYEIEDYERFIIWPDNVTLASVASGDEAVFTVQMPEDSSGNVTIMIYRIGGDHEYKEITIPYVGTAIFKASDIPAGYWSLDNFNVTSDKYGFFRFSYTTWWWANGFYDYFKVINSNATKIDPKLSVSVDDVDAGQSAVVKISLNETISGSVLLSVGGSNYTVSVRNGVASQAVPGLAVGTYDAVVYYAGSEYFTASQKTASFKVNEVKVPSGNESGNTTPSDNGSDNATPTVVVDPKIVASNVNVVYSAGSYYTIKVYGNDGKLANGVRVKITGKISKTLRSLNGIAKFKITQVPGKYKITINALGKKVTKTITVKHIVTLKTATLKKSAKKLTLQATLAKANGKYLAKKTITFKINGKKVATAKTNSKGVAKITIKNPSVVKNLKVGKKATYQATYLKDTVKKTAKIKK